MSVAATETLPIPRPGEVDLPALRAALDAATHAERLAWMWSVKRRHIGELFALTHDAPVGLEDLIIGDGPTVCEGRNALLVFSAFAKVFARVDGKIVGYNRNAKFQAFFAGPGHFELVPAPEGPGVIVEYRKPVDKTHPSFPKLRPNTGLIPYIVFGCMYDVIHRVSEHVFVGDAVRTLPGGAGFLLVRPPG